MDAGPVWAWREFPMREATKASLYRREVTDAALACVFEALARLAAGETQRADAGQSRRAAALRPACGASAAPHRLRAVHGVEDALRIVRARRRLARRAADLCSGSDWRVFDASARRRARRRARRGRSRARQAAVAVGLRDGAVWIGQAKRPGAREIKLPAALAMAAHLDGLPFAAGPSPLRYDGGRRRRLLSFDFYNGAFATADCEALSAALDRALARRPRVLVLLGGADCWSNGMHLGVIEARRVARRRVLAQHQRDERSGASASRAPTASGSSRRCAATPAPAACSCRSPPTKCGWARTSSSIRTTRTWAISTARNTGPICCRKRVGEARARGIAAGASADGDRRGDAARARRARALPADPARADEDDSRAARAALAADARASRAASKPSGAGAPRTKR